MYRSFFSASSLTILVLLLLSLVSPAVYSNSHPSEPIAFIGHGAMFDKEGKEIDVTPEFVQEAQEYYSRILYEKASKEHKAQFDIVKSRLFDSKKWDKQGELTANAALLEWLIKEVNPKGAHLLQGKNNLLKYKLRKYLSGDKAGNTYTPPKLLTDLIKQGASDKKVGRNVRGFSTMLGGQDYIDQCAASGVPTPPPWGDARWESVDVLEDEFIVSSSEAQVYKYTSPATEGACIALPRVDGNTISALGIICVGKQTSKACFWDNQEDDLNGDLEVFDIGINEDVDLIKFAGGADLLGSANGVCSDCHSGENPFVIHPNTALGMPALGTLDIMPNDWYDPLVHPLWPQNAGPTTILDNNNVPSPGDCTSCHYQEYAGRFPKISSAISGYCTFVLNNAVIRTMPPGDAGNPDYSEHVDALQDLCSEDPTAILRVDSVLDFKDVELGFAFKKALVIHNDGDAPLTISVSRITPNSDPALGHFSELNEITPIVIQPGDAPVVLTQVYEPEALGTHTIQMEVVPDDPDIPAQVVTLTGNGVAPVPIDTVLVLDRSGSMDNAAGDRKKIEAMRDAAMLYTDLLREDVGNSGTGDKLGYVKYNDQNSVYMDFDFISDAKKNAIEALELNDNALVNSARLKPEGNTGIGGAMETAANEIGGVLNERKQVMVVLTDGKENEEPYINDVIGDIRSDNPNLQMYSVGVGFNIEPTKLQNITNMGEEGYHQVSDSLSGVSLFDLETFYFKIFSNAAGMDLVVDPTHSVNLQTPGTIFIDKARIISSDRRADFLVLDDPVLRTYYNLEFVTPSGEVIVPGVTVGGIPIQEMSRHTYKIYRVVFPDMAQADSYVGDWILRLTPNGEWDQKDIKRILAQSDINYSTYINPYEGNVPVGFAAAVASNYKLDVQLQASSFLPGAEVRVTGALSDRGWPAVDGQINVTVTAPDDATYSFVLYDDGTHGDQDVNDATWTNRFLQTGVPGVYKFFFQSTGNNERGELAPREATRYLTLMQPEFTPEDDKPCIPCLLLKILIVLALILLIMIWYCCCYRKHK